MTLGCPGCRGPMRSLDLDRRPDGQVTIDLCGDCQALWFDAFESAQLTPGATLELFRVVHATTPGTRRALPADLPCPRCETTLALTHDLQHATRFSYYRCRYGHGRFTPFFQFLRELDAAEQKRLAPDPDQLGDSIVALARLQSEMEREREREAVHNDVDLVGFGLSLLGRVLHW